MAYIHASFFIYTKVMYSLRFFLISNTGFSMVWVVYQLIEQTVQFYLGAGQSVAL